MKPKITLPRFRLELREIFVRAGRGCGSSSCQIQKGNGSHHCLCLPMDFAASLRELADELDAWGGGQFGRSRC